MKYILVLVFMVMTFNGIGQEQKSVTIYTLDNEVYFGELISISNDSLVIDHKSFGILRIARSNVKRLHDGPRLPSAPEQLAEPYYVPTGISNGKGNHYYRNYALFGNNFSFGLNDHVELSAGFETASIIFSSGSLPITQLGVKVSEQFSDNLHIGLSTRALFNSDGGITMLSLPVTVGNKRNNLTFAPTIGFLLGEDSRDFIGLFNANISLSNKLRLITDGLYSEGFILATSMIEIQTKMKPIICLGVLYSTEFNILPNASITFPFGKWEKKELTVE